MRELTLRICGHGDERALVRLAERDSSVVPAGRLLAAETGGRLIAAISLETRAVIADPFLPTADAVELLRRRARQVGGLDSGSWRRVQSRRPSLRTLVLRRSSSSAG
jgi:hypothetical protein